MASKFRNEIVFYLNGARNAVGADRAGLMLADYLRYQKRLTGTKIVCAEGDCGACSVLRYSELDGDRAFVPVNSCILPVAMADGLSLVTVDALGGNPAQSAMVDCNGSQCGFCTPGFAIAMTGLVEKKLSAKSDPISAKEAQNALTGNLCRCTGYQPIIDAAVSIDLSKCSPLRAQFFKSEQSRELRKVRSSPVRIESEGFSFFAPISLREACQYLAKHPDARIVGGTSDLGVVHNKRRLRLRKLLSLHLIPELYRISKRSSTISVGARVTLSSLRRTLKTQAPEFASFLDLFASPQIKNVATLVGNIANASPIADTPPFLLVSDAVVEIQGPKAKRVLPLENFYLGYRKTALRKGELVRAVSFRLSNKSESLRLLKVSQRKDLDISAVNAAFLLQWKKPSDLRISRARLSLGGVAATPLRLKRTEKVLENQSLDPSLIDSAVSALQSDISPITDLRGTAAFRRTVAENLLRRFLNEQLEKRAES